jgi:hypothetical protein
MNMAAFVSLEDISVALPPYNEEVVAVEMDRVLAKAYSKLEEDRRRAARTSRQLVSDQHRDECVAAVSGPPGLGTLYGFETNKETGERERFLISEPADLDQNFVYAKERRLIAEIKTELANGRKVQLFAAYTQKRDVTRRLQEMLWKEGIRAEVLTAQMPPEQREAWYERQSAQWTFAFHIPFLFAPALILGHPSLISFQSGYSLYTLRQASRRSWRIGQSQPVRVVLYLHYEGTMQSSCLRLMAKKMLVSLAMDGKFDEGGLHSFEVRRG